MTKMMACNMLLRIAKNALPCDLRTDRTVAAIEFHHPEFFGSHRIEVFRHPAPGTGPDVLQRPAHHRCVEIHSVLDEGLEVIGAVVREDEKVIGGDLACRRAEAGEPVKQPFEAEFRHRLHMEGPDHLDPVEAEKLLEIIPYHAVPVRWEVSARRPRV